MEKVDLSRKREVEVKEEEVTLLEDCSAISQTRIPEKQTNTGSFTIPCKIGGFDIENALCDTGTGISLMPLETYKSLKLKSMKETNIKLQFADRFIKKPEGIVEDVLVSINSKHVPCDFVIFDMGKDVDAPIIFGQPFLKTANCTLDLG